jgi:hypothetical protein
MTEVTFMEWGWVIIVFGLVIVVWLGVLTYLFAKEKGFIEKLFPDSGERDIRQKFKEILEEIEGFRVNQGDFKKQLEDIKLDNLAHIQKIELSKYNPYKDTGGDQSFSLVLLDGNLNGVIVTSLHSRAGTRIYTKLVTKGKTGVQLSKEEQLILGKVTKT